MHWKQIKRNCVSYLFYFIVFVSDSVCNCNYRTIFFCYREEGSILIAVPTKYTHYWVLAECYELHTITIIIIIIYKRARGRNSRVNWHSKAWAWWFSLGSYVEQNQRHLQLLRERLNFILNFNSYFNTELRCCKLSFIIVIRNDLKKKKIIYLFILF